LKHSRGLSCRYCGASNPEDEHRCNRCGRRLRLANPRPAPETYPLASSESSAPELALPPPAPAAGANAAPQASRRGSYQSHLFPAQEVPRVIRLQPRAPGQAAQPAREHRPAQRKAPPPGQQRIEFPAPVPGARRSLKTSVEAVIYCEAQVASPPHRMIAAALDSSMVLIACGAFLVVFHLAGFEMLFGRYNTGVYLALVGVISLFYKSLWCVADQDSPGLRWSQLRLLNFDGRRPGRRERLYRLAGGCLSLVAGGLGLLWALVDEESLGWHDHMSKTFPTPEDSLAAGARRF
jgi:uncharacterized RDD family membrane protein YckC